MLELDLVLLLIENKRAAVLNTHLVRWQRGRSRAAFLDPDDVHPVRGNVYALGPKADEQERADSATQNDSGVTH